MFILKISYIQNLSAPVFEEKTVGVNCSQTLSVGIHFIHCLPGSENTAPKTVAQGVDSI